MQRHWSHGGKDQLQELNIERTMAPAKENTFQYMFYLFVSLSKHWNPEQINNDKKRESNIKDEERDGGGWMDGCNMVSIFSSSRP